MKLLAVDVGNSSIKAGIVAAHAGEWQTLFRWRNPDEFRIDSDEPHAWRIASVNRPLCAQLVQWIETCRPADQVQLLNWTQVPLRIEVDSPQAVGIDRLCAALAGHRRANRRACIVIDAGTAVTVDGVSADGAFLGGCIFLGLRGALDQLARSTDALPRLETPIAPPTGPFGKSTADAMLTGTSYALAGAIREIVERMQGSFAQSAQIFLTGGSASLVNSLLPFNTICIEHLVLDGIAAVGPLEPHLDARKT